MRPCCASFGVGSAFRRGTGLVRDRGLGFRIRPYSSVAALDMEKVHTTERLAHLRSLMKQHELDIYSQ